MSSSLFEGKKKNVSLYGVLILCFCILFSVLPAKAAGEWVWTIPTPGSAPLKQDMPVKKDVYSLVINELYPEPLKGEKEFIELYNYGSEAGDISGWQLEDASGALFTIPTGTIIQAKGYVLLERTVSLNNTQDEVRLLSPEGEERDFVEYTKDLVVQGVSLGRYCEVYELLFCDLQSSIPTPGKENSVKKLLVHASEKDGVYPVGTSIRLESTDSKAKIFYTFDPDKGDMTEHHLYTEPFVLQEDMNIYFYALVGELSSPLMEAHFRILNQQKSKDYGVHISEVYFGSGSTFDHSSWMELKFLGKKKLDLSGWSVSDKKSGLCLVGEYCVKIAKGISLYPKGIKVVTLPETASYIPQSLYLLDGERNIVSEVHMPLWKNGKSFVKARTTSHTRLFSLNLEDAFLWSDFPTKGKENIVAEYKGEDGDGDLLSNEEESLLNTRSDEFDSNGNTLPDFFDKGREHTASGSQFFYRQVLTDMMQGGILGEKISGRALPDSSVEVYAENHEKIAMIKTDGEGYFSWTPTVEELSLRTFYLVLKDQGDMKSFAGDPMMFQESQPFHTAGMIEKGEVVISKIFPNPKGRDTKEEEWIEFTNLSTQALSLQGYTLMIGEYSVVLKNSQEIPSKGILRVLASELGRSLPNLTGTLKLLSPEGGELDFFSYEQAREDVVLMADTKENPLVKKAQVAVKTVKKASTQASVKKNTALSTPLLPRLEEIAGGETLPLYPTYAVSALASQQTQNEMELTPGYGASSPKEDMGYTILAFVGGFMTTVSSFIFWKF